MTIARPPLDTRSLRIIPLSDAGLLDAFDSGESEIDRNIDRCCERHHKYRSRVFCAIVDGEQSAYGFYCLSISASESKYLAEEIIRANEGRAFVPFLYINYLAVRKDWQNQKIGTLLLIDALTRCERVVRDVGVYGVALNALTERAARLYEKYGFRPYGETKYPLMILPARSLIELFASSAP